MTTEIHLKAGDPDVALLRESLESACGTEDRTDRDALWSVAWDGGDRTVRAIADRYIAGAGMTGRAYFHATRLPEWA